jgi:hypothetical protein
MHLSSNESLSAGNNPKITFKALDMRSNDLRAEGGSEERLCLPDEINLCHIMVLAQQGTPNLQAPKRVIVGFVVMR